MILPMVEVFSIRGLKALTPSINRDARCFFSEIFNADSFGEAGRAETFVQDNHSRSAQAGKIRRLHFQTDPQEPRCRGRRTERLVFRFRHLLPLAAPSEQMPEPKGTLVS